MDVAAAAVAHVEPIQLAAAEHGHLLLWLQRQHAVVFQQHAALGPRLTDQFSRPRRHVPLALGSGLLLHEAVAHGFVDNLLGQLAQFLL